MGSKNVAICNIVVMQHVSNVVAERRPN